VGFCECGNELSGSIHKIQVISCIASAEGLCSKKVVFLFLMDHMLDMTNNNADQ
jgi:hypothetical protein